ncbi:MAG: hypothetical protein ABI136_01500 [Ginsengibacter sp.]
MKKNQILYLFAALAIFASCKKEDAKPNATGINGTYKFNGMHAKTNSTVTSDDGEKIVSLAEWSSADNTGTIVFNDPVATNTNFSYSVNSTVTNNIYEDNKLINSMSKPFVVIIPNTNSVSSYQLIGADSIYFPKGGFVSIGGTTSSSNAGGGHYKLSGNTLTLDMSGSKDSTFSDSGIMYQTKQSVIASIVLIKQ